MVDIAGNFKFISSLNITVRSYVRIIFSLFILVTAEGWTDVMTSLRWSSANFGLYFFIISFLFIGHFIFGNLFVAVVIEQIDRGMLKFARYDVSYVLCKLCKHS